jgi:HSP20 family protein
MEVMTMAIVRYDPFQTVNQLHREVNRLFDINRYSDDEAGGIPASDWAPAVDIKEEADRFVLHADLPGVDPKNIEITMEQGVLSLKGQRVFEDKQETDKYRRVERVRGTFLRRFSLPEAVDTDGISAKSHNGVLEVIVPKSQQAQPRRITVEG